jgi:assimilatory nitrate reductase catalytic subunit
VGESEGTTTNMERTVSRVRAATDVPSGVRTDPAPIQAHGDGVVPVLFEGRDPEGVFEELAALTAGTPADLSGMSYDRLDAAGAVRWPAPDATSAGGYRYHREDDDGERWAVPTPSGRARFSTAGHGALPEPTDDRFPLTLTTGREADGYNTGIRSRGDETAERPRARVHPATLAAHGDDLAVESRRATVPVRVAADDAVPEGVVWLPIHHPRTNELTLPATDPRSDEPNYKQCAVRLVPAADGADASATGRAPGDD